VTLASSVINESFCQFSFSYLVAPSAQLIVWIGGVGEVWSSVEVSGGPGWLVTAGAASLYAGLDNLTLHPCIDCDTPGNMIHGG